MPARTFLLLIVTVIGAAGLTIAAAQTLGLPIAVFSLAGIAAALCLRLWMSHK